jgi:hypothetical protein
MINNINIVLYYVENSWCFLNISLKNNNIYWIDWECIYDKNGNLITNKKDITLDYIYDKNLLFRKDETYFYYNTTSKTIYDLTNKILQLSVEGTNNLDNLYKIENEFDTYIINI